MKQRYEWLEIIGKMFSGGESAADKFCRACKAAKKNKNCDQCDRTITLLK
jgi:hypothetical protein